MRARSGRPAVSGATVEARRPHARTLREAGVEDKQAEAHAEAARALRAGLATKADLDSLEMRLDARFEARSPDFS